MVQWYGFRGRVVQPEHNVLARWWAAKNKVDLNMIYYSDGRFYDEPRSETPFPDLDINEPTIGDMAAFQSYQLGQAMPVAAANPAGGLAGAGVGLGMGMAMANVMGQSMGVTGQQGAAGGAAGAAAGPPPVTCPACGKQVPAGKFCPECGKPLGPVCSACGKPMEPGSKFCPECGAKQGGGKACVKCGGELEEGDQFCPECGAKQE